MTELGSVLQRPHAEPQLLPCATQGPLLPLKDKGAAPMELGSAQLHPSPCPAALLSFTPLYRPLQSLLTSIEHLSWGTHSFSTLSAFTHLVFMSTLCERENQNRCLEGKSRLREERRLPPGSPWHLTSKGGRGYLCLHPASLPVSLYRQRVPPSTQSTSRWMPCPYPISPLPPTLLPKTPFLCIPTLMLQCRPPPLLSRVTIPTSPLVPSL